MNTPSVQSIAGQSSSDPSWRLCSSLETIPSPQTPRSINFNILHRSSSFWITRRMTSEVKPSLTSDQSLHQPAQFGRASTSSSAYENVDVTPPPQSATILPTRGSISVVRADTRQVGAARLGFAIEDVGAHFLCYGRAMAMHIMGVPGRNLMAIGRWRLLGFAVYI